MQNYTINSYQSDHVGQSDLQNMENNFECLRSTFSGSSTPANVVAGKQWFDTNKKLLKIRNNANLAWYGVMCGDASQKMIVYRNTAMDGWAIDSSVTDKVVGIKGGSVYTTGGVTAGTWASSSHILLTAEMPIHNHVANQVAHNHTFPNLTFAYGSDGYDGSGGGEARGSGGLSTSYIATTMNTATPAITVNNRGGGEGHIHAADANIRPTAAVCTIQYLSI